MRPAIVVLVALSVALLAACSDDDEVSQTLAITDTPSPTASPPDTDCGLGAIPSSTRTADLSWNGWEPEYTTNSVAEEIMGADAIVRGRVLKEVRVEVPTGFNQMACIWIEEVYRGDRLTPGETVVAGWPAAHAIDEIHFDPRIGYVDGADYILLLGQANGGFNYDFVGPIDYRTWLRDVYPLDLDGPGAPPSQQAIDDLIAMVQRSPDISGAVEGELARHGLEMPYGLSVIRIEFPALFPDVRGTLTPPTHPDFFLWRSNYNQIHDSIIAGGYDWQTVISGPAFSVSASARPVGSSDETVTVSAGFVFRDGEMLASFIAGQHSAWTLDQYDLAAAEDFSYPPKVTNRGPATVNLAEWFGIDTITAVRYKGGDARLTDGSFATPESRQTLADALNRDFQTHPTAGDDVNPNYGCAGSNLFIVLSSGWTAIVTYHSPTNRLYATDDGFYVDAPPELGPLLGIEPFSEGQCSGEATVAKLFFGGCWSVACQPCVVPLFVRCDPLQSIKRALVGVHLQATDAGGERAGE